MGAVILCVTVGAAVFGTVNHAELSSSSPPAAAALTLAFEDGSLARLSVGGGALEKLPAETLRSVHAVTSTQLALDRRTGLLWYSDSHTTIRSVDLQTGEPHGSLGGFADVALVGCATTGEGRPLAIDSLRRRLFVPVATGGILAYDLDTLRLTGVISAASLETEAGLLPAIAVQEPTGALWYGAADGSIAEVGGATLRPTGRRLQYAHDAHALRALTFAGGRLLALDMDGSLRRYDLGLALEIEAPVLPEGARPIGIAAAD